MLTLPSLGPSSFRHQWARDSCWDQQDSTRVHSSRWQGAALGVSELLALFYRPPRSHLALGDTETCTAPTRSKIRKSQMSPHPSNVSIGGLRKIQTPVQGQSSLFPPLGTPTADDKPEMNSVRGIRGLEPCDSEEASKSAPSSIPEALASCFPIGSSQDGFCGGHCHHLSP